MDFSAAWVLPVQSELWDLWDCVAGRDESAASTWTGKAAEVGLEREAAAAAGFRFLLISLEQGGPRCIFVCLAVQCAGEHLLWEASARTSREYKGDNGLNSCAQATMWWKSEASTLFFLERRKPSEKIKKGRAEPSYLVAVSLPHRW